MSGRRQRAKSARAIASEEQFGKRKSITKPKYVDSSRRSETPTSARSRMSTPSSSRHPSRSPSPPASVGTGKRRSSINSLPPRSSGRPKRGTVNSSGSNTPIGRGSRSSSVASARNHHKRKAAAAALVTPKIKAKSGRGYNPSLVNYKESEYHYGSDFEDDAEDDQEEQLSEHSSDEEDEDVDSDDLKVESDLELDLDAPAPVDSRSTTPVPFWLRTGDEVPPPLTIPPSSEDLLVSSDIILKTASTYEVLRHYRLLLRLSPFRFEDFCAALAAEEQSNLLSEIHIALLKSIVRAEEKDNTTFAPLDQKDSVNCLFFFMDSLSWPDCLRAFLSADPVIHAEPLQILEEHKEYPISTPPSTAWIQARVEMLSYLADQFLTTNAVREDIVTEGATSMEDHCRVCHRLGDMLVCEQCSGVFHLACLDPPLHDVPEDDWQCYVCQANEVHGVTDCDNEQERSMTRHEALGTDRGGNKYWFLCRRLFVEGLDGSVSYYSTAKQLQEVLIALDPELYEAELCEAIEDIRPEMERQMAITEKLTNEKKASFRKSYLELENAAIEKLQQERELKKLAEAEEKRRIQDDAARKMREEEERKKRLDDEAKQLEEEKRRKLREERLRKREESRGDAFPNSLDLLNDLDGDFKLDDMDLDTSAPLHESETEVKTEPENSTEEGTEPEVKIKDEENQPELSTGNDEVQAMETDSKEDVIKKEETVDDNTSKNAVKPVTTPSATTGKLTDVETAAGDLRLTRKTIQQINTGTLFFKLGQEATYKTYVNQFTTNPSALSKVQATEERVKRTHLSHKFSLTDASAFKWLGTIHGARTQVVSTLRATMLQLENNIPSIFMHVNWGLCRKSWIGAVSTSNTPRDFARALTVLQCCLKPCVLLNVWYDSLGHTQLKKFTGQMKEDKKKLEKRERREKEEEDEKLRPYMGFVKYTLGLKHQVAKQRGEEYRAHGQHGWLWLSATRNFCPSDARKVGLRAGPHRLAVKYTDIRDKSYKIVLMEPNAFEYLLKKQDEIDLQKAMGLTEEEMAAAQETAEKDESGKNKERSKLEQALKNARLARQVPEDDAFANVVDVEDGMSKNTRSLYPKIGGKVKILNDFLSRRLQLKSLEERRFELQTGVKPDEPTSTTSSNGASKTQKDVNVENLGKFVDESKKSLWAMIAKVKESTTAVDSDAQSVVTAASTTVKPQRPDEMICYSVTCSKAVKGDYQCYSVTCKNNKRRSQDVVPVVAPQTVPCPAVKESFALYNALCQSALSHGISVPAKTEFSSKEVSITELQNFVKILMQKKEETASKPTVNGEVVDAKTDATTSQDSNGTIDEESKKKQSQEGRIYSSKDTSGKLYLKRIQSVGDPKAKTSKEIRYPLAPSFHSKARNKHNILLLAKYDVKRMARKAGTVTAEGFNYNAKANNQVWPYPCPRPTFKTAWLFRTACLESLQAVALQLRILWACAKWDDMQTKPLTSDGKHQVTSDSAITTTEILKCRTTGRFQERTEYLQRKITIPLDVPKTIKEVMPIRSGLRKRKRAESPQQMEPKVTEEWVEEEKLELWEIRAYREKLDREKAMSLTRSRTGTTLKEPQRLDPAESNKSRRSEGDMKSKMEEQLRLQREALQKKAATSASVVRTSVNTTPTPTIIRKVTNPDGSVSIVRTVQRPIMAGTATTPIATGGAPAPKRIFVTKDGKVIHQPPQSVLQQIKPAATGMASAASPTTPATPTSQQKVQIVRSTDGKIQVRGLLPGQQLIQMPDGKLQIVTQTIMKSNNPSPAAGSTPSSPATVGVAQQGQNKIVIQPNSVPGGQMKQVLTPGTPQQQQQTVIGSPLKVTPNAVGMPTTPNQILATQLAPGSQIPPGTTTFVSGGKTYCIPKASATLAGGAQLPQHPVTNLAPAAQTNLTSSSITAQSPLPIAPTQISSATPTTTPTAVVQQQPKQMVEVKTLGQNVVSFKGTQMIVQGPDIAQAQHIARQLSSGAARLAMLHGKQVLISTTPTIVQQPQQQVVQQQQITAPLPIQPAQVQPPALPQQPIQPSPVKTDNILDNVKLPTEPLPPPQLKSEPEPATTLPQSPVKPPIQITAQLVNTPQGPRIILQGIQGASLPKQYLMSIQQQVKTQLLKAQAEAKQQNRVPPTKIVIQLPASILQSQLENDQNKPVIASPPQQQQQLVLPTQPLAPVPSLPSPVAPPAQVMNSIRSPRPLAPQTPTSVGSPRPVVLQQILNSNPGQRFVLIGPSGTKMAMLSSPTSQGMMTSPVGNTNNIIVTSQSVAEKPLSVLLPTTPHPPSMIFSTASTTPNTTTTTAPANNSMVSPTSNENSDRFELTPDYIQRAISDALKSQNLSPEIEQKLLALQHHTIEKGVTTSVTRSTNSTPVSAPKKNLAPIDPLTGEPMDDEWEPATRPRSGGSRKRKAPSTTATSTAISDASDNGVAAPTILMSNPPATTVQSVTTSRAPATPPRNRSKSGQRSGPVNHPISLSTTTTTTVATTTALGSPSFAVSDEKKRQQAMHKLQTILTRHKEQLKKDIARKRSQQEKDLQIEIHRQIEKAKLEHQQISAASTGGPAYGQMAANSYETVSSTSNDVTASHQGKRKRRDSTLNNSDVASVTTATSQHPPQHASPPKKKKRTSSSSNAVSAGMVKKNTVYCICKTKYDPSKFYVGCDVCNNWFHGSCIGISESNAKNLSEYVCDECKKARENQEIYCLCKQPYDESQFYIGCERCTDWFHGHCVGILQVEADNIDEYLCPRCDPTSAMNKPNSKPLQPKDYELVKKIVKQLMVNRYSGSFKEPVNPSTVPNYYKVVKVPMDLQTIEDRVNQQYYNKLSEFVGDVMRIFENCRFFNQPNSQIMKSAVALESFFASKLAMLREKIAAS